MFGMCVLSKSFYPIVQRLFCDTPIAIMMVLPEWPIHVVICVL